MLNAKKMFTKILNNKMGMPDYDNASAFSFSWNTDITMTANGFVIAKMNTATNGAYMAASVNGITVWVVVGATANTREYIGMFPVKKGDVVKFTQAYSPTGTAQFVPYK